MAYDAHTDELAAVGDAAHRAGLINIAAGAGAMAVGLIADTTVIVGIAAGYLIGAVNISLLLRTLRAGVNLDAKKAARSVASSYYLRFGAICLIFYFTISRGWFNPWQLIIGFSAAIFSIIGVLIFAASNRFNQTAETNPQLKNVFKRRG